MPHVVRQLITTLNPSPGWWAIYGLSWATITLWLFAALPWIDAAIGSPMDIGRFREGYGLTLAVYNICEIGEPMADYYLLAVFAGAPLVKLCWHLVEISGTLARGSMFALNADGELFAYREIRYEYP